MPAAIRHYAAAVPAASARHQSKQPRKKGTGHDQP